MYRPGIAADDVMRVRDLQVNEATLSFSPPTDSDWVRAERVAGWEGGSFSFGPGAVTVSVSGIGSNSYSISGLYLPKALRIDQAYVIEYAVVANFAMDGYEYSSANVNNATLFPAISFVDGNMSANSNLPGRRFLPLPVEHNTAGFSARGKLVITDNAIDYDSAHEFVIGVGIQARSTSNYVVTIPRLSGVICCSRYVADVDTFEPNRQ